ncbi:MAG: hypothetical protein Q9166_003746 [cf. Caloplaca sp. 2 TL-2023]
MSFGMATTSSVFSALSLARGGVFEPWFLLQSVLVTPVTGESQAGLACTYDAIPQKKGPKGSRAKVISELRLKEGQKRAEHRRQESMHNYGSPASSPSSPRLSGLLTQELIDGCMDFYFAQLYPTMPIMHNDQLWTLVAEMDTSVEAYCLLCSFCAFMLIQPGIETKGSQAIRPLVNSCSRTTLGGGLLDDALRRRKGYDYIESSSVNAVITSFFLFGCFFGLDKHNTAWFHLREATTLAQIIGMQDEKTYSNCSPVVATSMRRLFWLLFVTERAYALQRHRPLTLHATINLPSVAEDPSNPVAGFIHLVNLYRPFDDIFIGLWNKSKTDCSTLCLAQLQTQLSQALPAVLDSTETQAADLRTSQHWLRTMVWQLSITNGYLSSTSPDSSMTFGYPIEIAKDLVAVTSQLSRRSMEVHGVGLIEKIFDVACTLIDVMSSPRINAFFAAIRSSPQGSLPLFATGFCWGGLHAINLTHATSVTEEGKHLIDAVFAAHSSGVILPGDVEKVERPLSLSQGSKDFVLNMKGVKQIEEVLAKKNKEDGEKARYEIEVVEGVKQRFAVRGNPEDEVELAQAQKAR